MPNLTGFQGGFLFAVLIVAFIGIVVGIVLIIINRSKIKILINDVESNEREVRLLIDENEKNSDSQIESLERDYSASIAESIAALKTAITSEVDSRLDKFENRLKTFSIKD